MTKMQNLDDEARRRFCDRTIAQAAELMHEYGASVPMIIDRLVTYSAAQACVIDGEENAASAFRQAAQHIEDGAFAHLTGAGQVRH